MSNSKILSYNLFAHAVSGSAASCVALAASFPFITLVQRKQLDDLKDLKHLNTLQLIQYLIKKEGFASLYRGLLPVMQSSCISNFVYFYCFHFLKSLRSKDSQSAAADLLLGAIAGSINVISTTPFWVVNTRLKMHGVSDCDLPYSDLISGLKYVARNEGWQKLWSGTSASLLLVSNPAIQFSVYESIKRYLTQMQGNESPSVLYYFFLGAVSKMIATFITYPLQLVQTKLRHGNDEIKKNLPPNPGTFEILLYMLKSRGIAGLFTGFEAKIWQTVFTAALMFMSYEKIIRFVKTLLRASAAANAAH